MTGGSSIVDALDKLLVTRLVVTSGSEKLLMGPYRFEVIPREPRLLMVSRGSIFLGANGVERALKARTWALLPSLTPRVLSIPKGSSAACHVLGFITLEPTLSDFDECLLGRVADPDCEVRAFGRILKRIAERSRRAELQAEGEAKAVLARFLASLGSESDVRAFGSRASCSSIDKATRYVLENYRDPDIVQKLPKVADLHPNYFRELFKRRMGLTPSEFVLQTRMRAARFLQNQPGVRVKEVAAKVGFNDQFYYSRLYSRYWGHSPSRGGD